MGAHLNARRHNIARAGRPYTLRRQTAYTPAATYSSVTVQGYRRTYRTDELSGALVQGDWALEILNDEIAAATWSGPPINGDELLDGSLATYAVQGAAPVYEGSTLIGYTLQIRGGG